MVPSFDWLGGVIIPFIVGFLAGLIAGIFAEGVRDMLAEHYLPSHVAVGPVSEIKRPTERFWCVPVSIDVSRWMTVIAPRLRAVTATVKFIQNSDASTSIIRKYRGAWVSGEWDEHAIDLLIGHSYQLKVVTEFGPGKLRPVNELLDPELNGTYDIILTLQSGMLLIAERCYKDAIITGTVHGS